MDDQRQKRLQAIGAIYDEIPKVHCRGLCGECCGPLLVTELELEIMAEQAGR